MRKKILIIICRVLLVVISVFAARTVCLNQGKPTEDIDELLLRIINVPSKKVSVKSEK